MTLSTFKHLRFPFSILLAPVFFFAVSQTVPKNWISIAIAFVVLHVFIYPASNGYNSYYDRDEGAIGGLSTPPPVTQDLVFWSWGLEAAGIVAAFLLDYRFAFMLLIYGVFSKLYSHPRTRIKARPIASWLVVIFFQGAWIYSATVIGVESSAQFSFHRHLLPAIISTLLLAGAYPLTQVFQHEEDARRGDRTLSRLLGMRGTFVFSAGCFMVAGSSLIVYLATTGQEKSAVMAPILLAPALIFFLYWYVRVLKNSDEASFTNTMRMSVLWAAGAIVLFAMMWSKPASALDAELYLLESTAKGDSSADIVFRFHSKDSAAELKTVRETRFETNSGKIAAEEKVVFRSLNDIVEYTLDHRQTKTVVKIKKLGNRFEAEISIDGKVNQDSASADGDVLVPPMIIDRIQADLPILMDGKKIDFKVLIPDIMQTITFRAQKIRIEDGRIVIRLSPANWLIAAFAPPPLSFFFDEKTKNIVEAQGQTLLIDEKGKPFFSRTVFKSKSKQDGAH